MSIVNSHDDIVCPPSDKESPTDKTIANEVLGSVASLVPKPVYGLDDSSDLPSMTRVIALTHSSAY